MATLICTQFPSLSIYQPADGSWIQFRGGRLDIEDDDPNYAVVMAEAASNPAIAVYVNASTCIHCGETFASKKALDGHVKDVHFAEYLAAEDAAHAETRIALIKEREGFACDICPHAEFGTAEDLSLHVQAIHTAPPDLGDAGAGSLGPEGAGGEDGKPKARRKRAGEVDPN